jgi:hypothetical protein
VGEFVVDGSKSYTRVCYRSAKYLHTSITNESVCTGAGQVQGLSQEISMTELREKKLGTGID